MLCKLNQFILYQNVTVVKVFTRNNFEIDQIKRWLEIQERERWREKKNCILPTSHKIALLYLFRTAVKVWSILDSIFMIVLSLKEIEA